MKSLFTLFLVLVTSGLAFSQDKPKKIKHGLRFTYIQKSMHDGHRQREFTKVELYLYKKETRFTFENIKNVKIAVFRRGKLKTIKDALLKSYPTSIQRYFIVLEGLPKDPWKHGYHYGVIFDYKEPAGIKTVRYISNDPSTKDKMETFQVVAASKDTEENAEENEEISELLSLYYFPPRVTATNGPKKNPYPEEKGYIIFLLPTLGFGYDDIKDPKLYLLKGGAKVSEFTVGVKREERLMRKRQQFRFDVETKGLDLRDPSSHFGVSFIIKNDTCHIEVTYIQKDPRNPKSVDRLYQRPVVEDEKKESDEKK